MNPTDKFIATGFWSQLILLVLVDWGSLHAFYKGHGIWYHYIGFALVNIILLYSTYVVWGWMKKAAAENEAVRQETESP